MREYMRCVSPVLSEILKEIMAEPLFSPFRLVGGTNLALRYNHRVSTDIDLFTDSPYGSLDFRIFEKWFKQHFPYFETSDTSSKVGMGRTYYIGEDSEHAVKIDLIYESEPFILPTEVENSVRMATLTDIAVMKLDAIFYGGRKKDFWDLHFIVTDRDMDMSELISLHKKRFPYQHDLNQMLNRLQDFTKADDEPDPICNLGKSWDMIKLDILDLTSDLTV